MSPAKSPKWRAMLAMAFGIVGFAWGPMPGRNPRPPFSMRPASQLATCWNRACWPPRRSYGWKRTEIDKVLRERKITELLGPAACSECAVLGRLLKADVPVLMGPRQRPGKTGPTRGL